MRIKYKTQILVFQRPRGNLKVVEIFIYFRVYKLKIPSKKVEKKMKFSEWTFNVLHGKAINNNVHRFTGSKLYFSFFRKQNKKSRKLELPV